MSRKYEPASEPQVGVCCFDKTDTLTSEEWGSSSIAVQLSDTQVYEP